MRSHVIQVMWLKGEAWHRIVHNPRASAGQLRTLRARAVLS